MFHRYLSSKSLMLAAGELLLGYGCPWPIALCKKWMPDAFALDEEGNRISAGDAIIRELVVNSLIHREYTSPILQELLLTQMHSYPQCEPRSVRRFSNPITV